LFDSEGSLKYKPELWNDIRKVILPQVANKVGYIPIPRVEYTDDGTDVVLENLTLQGMNILPNWISLDAHNHVKFSPYNAISDESHHEVVLGFGHIQCDMKDVAFYFNRKTGPVKWRDSGLADFVLGGEGLSGTIHLVSSDRDKSSVFKVKNVDIKIHSLAYKIRDSKHDKLYNMLKPLLGSGLVKKQIQKALADSIRTAFEYVDGQLVGVRDRMNEAKDSDEASRTQVLQTLFQRKKAEAASVKSKNNAQFKVTATRDSTIMPQIGTPAGWVNAQQERKDASKDGQAWHSRAFSIVNPEASGPTANTQARRTNAAPAA